MQKLPDVSPERLRTALAEADDPKAVKRLMVALCYCDCESVDTLSDRFGIAESTIYAWLDRFERLSIDDAATDGTPPGRPSKLGDCQRASLRADLEMAPATFGHEAERWTAELLAAHIDARYGVTYSTGHARRLLRSLRDDPG